MSNNIQLNYYKPADANTAESPPDYNQAQQTQKDDLGYQNEGYLDTESKPKDSSVRYRITSDEGELPPRLKSSPHNIHRESNGAIKEDSKGAIIQEEVVYEEEVFEFEDEDPGELNCFMRGVQSVQNNISTFLKDNKRILLLVLGFLCVGLYFAYFAWCMYYRFGDEGSIRLLWVTVLVLICIVIYVVHRYQGESISECMSPCTSKVSQHSTVISWVLVFLIYIAVAVVLIYDFAVLKKDPYNLVSLAGVCIYIFLMFIFSYSPSRVRWRPVAWGVAIQFVLALIILRTQWGYDAFKWVGDRISEFLSYTDAGSKFVFGDAYMHHFFAFKVLPIIIFFSTAISVLYYIGVMQVLIRGIAYVMQAAMATTAGESLNAAGNIFIGQSEAPLLIRPLLPRMTRSELHAVMTGGFATIAGSVMGAYMAMGIPANHLISASVMSAPAALAMSKLFYPETQKSKTTAEDVKVMEKLPESNIIAAASSGASASIRLVANITANLIAFLAILEFINATLTWFGIRAGLEPPHYSYLTFQFICSYLLYPFALIMGVELVNCRQVAQLIGVKTFLNEFIAYDNLHTLINNTNIMKTYNGSWDYVREDSFDIFLSDKNMTLVGGTLTERSTVIATYALCGFANIGSIGIMLGALGAMAPHRRSDLSRTVVRAMIAGNVACFLTACIAGLFHTPGI